MKRKGRLKTKMKPVMLVATEDQNSVNIFVLHMAIKMVHMPAVTFSS